MKTGYTIIRPKQDKTRLSKILNALWDAIATVNPIPGEGIETSPTSGQGTIISATGKKAAADGVSTETSAPVDSSDLEARIAAIEERLNNASAVATCNDDKIDITFTI